MKEKVRGRGGGGSTKEKAFLEESAMPQQAEAQQLRLGVQREVEARVAELRKELEEFKNKEKRK